MLRRWIASGLVLAGLGLGCGSRPSEPATPRLFVFALDGLEWRVLLPLLEAGRLPTLAGLIERGVAGRLETLVPTKSPRIWTSIATGRSPEDHGILDFVKHPEGEDGPAFPYLGLDRRVKAFWNILSDHEVRNATIGWWATWPAEFVDGLMLAQTHSKARRAGPIFDKQAGEPIGLVHPPAHEDAVLGAFDEFDATIDDWMARVFGTFPDDLPEPAADRVESCAWALRADLTYFAAGRYARSLEPPPRCTTIYAGGTDVVAHRFWAAHAPAVYGLTPDALEPRTFGHMVTAYYEFIDAQLGAFLAEEAPPFDVLVVSDHGMGRNLDWTRDQPVPKLSGQHTRGNDGVLILAGPSFRREPFGSYDRAPAEVPRIAHVYDLCPTILALCGVPAGADMPGRVLAEWLTPARADDVPARIPTHEDPAWHARRARRAATVTVRAESAERLEQLDALGYLEGDE